MEEFGKKFKHKAHKSIVSKWEKGLTKPNNERLKEIAELGNVSVDYILYGSIINYIYNNLDFENKDFKSHQLDSEAKLILSELVYSYIKQKEDFENLEYDEYLQLSKKYLPYIVAHYEKLGRQALDRLSKKPKEELENKRQSVIIDKYLSNDPIDINDFIKDYPFLENFKKNNYLFPQEVSKDNFDLLASILNEYFQLYNQIPVLDKEKKQRFMSLKKKSLELGTIFRNEYLKKKPSKTLNFILEILETEIPSFSDKEIKIAEKIENELKKENPDN
ncbi:helix-turn-helix domain-containing protein [Staphylococcus aureus]|uniref:helix-turn-helix domain-containing protein n=1 Tax=Staphylococcus aureus TaxID=1280 RepID=UPI0028DD9091|nr:helix-turn-helix domain-containing protein [Staphylococcus aureus]